MADAGIWKVSDAESQIVYVNIVPAQGPLVVDGHTIDGPETIFAGNATKGDEGGAAIPPGSDSTYLDLQLQSAL